MLNPVSAGRKDNEMKGKSVPAPAVTPQKTTVEQFTDGYNALVAKHNCMIKAFPIGAIGEKGQFEYRSLELRVVELPPQPEPAKPVGKLL